MYRYICIYIYICLQGAFILVGAEYGVTGFMDGNIFDRSSVYQYMEVIPDGSQDKPYCNISCSEPMKNQEAFQTSSCIAKQNGIYLTVNLIEEVPCTGRGCPQDGHYQYNTNLIYNSDGCLIGKYHKTHMFEEEKVRLNRPPVPQYVYFDTEYGRFGTMICMDILFHDPAISMVEKYGVRHILFPTAWDQSNDYVWLKSVEIHNAFAKRIGVNFLASNIREHSDWFAGSGIYTANGILNYTYDMRDDEGTIVTGVLEYNIKPTKLTPLTGPTITQNLPPSRPIFSPIHNVSIYNNTYRAVVLEGLSGRASVCYGELCCNLDYSRSGNSETYILAAYNGLQVLEGVFWVEICLVYRCSSSDLTTCHNRESASLTKFSLFKLYANFKADYVFPNVMPSGYKFRKIDWKFIREEKNYNAIEFSSNWPAVSAAMMGRDYDKDPE